MARDQRKPLDLFAFVPARRLAGEIIVDWNSVVLTGKVLNVGEFSLMIEFCSKQLKLQWQCTSVYFVVVRSRKLAFWEELRISVGLPVGPSIVCSDFNTIFVITDKVTGVPNMEDICNVNAFM